MSRLRHFQTDVKHSIYSAWNSGAQTVMPVVPTGGGKTVIVGDIIREYAGPSVAIAHRQELVGQISLALATEGVRHSFIADPKVRKAIVAAHMQELGRSFYNPHSRVRVCGVDTLIKLDAANDPWFKSVGLGVQDEGHHVLQKNKWGAAWRMFPNARWLLPTATAYRADGCGLGIKYDGYVDELVIGPSARVLIDDGYLTDYRVVCPPPSVDLSDVGVSETTGDFNQQRVREAVHRSSRLVGDVVKEYLRWAPGKLGITFAVDIQSATEIAQAYRDAGVPAEIVTSKTDGELRRSILRRFRNREILQLVNVDLFGEGFDLPAVEVVSMARPTQSFTLYAQQFGRALRLMISEILSGVWDTYTPEQRKQFIAESAKPRAIILDHVGNIERHGLPDAPREWSLARREKRAKSDTDAIPLRICLSETCMQPYERIYKCCPYCGFYPPPADRSSITLVDGDLSELDEITLRAMRGEIATIDGPSFAPGHLEPHVQRAIWLRHLERQQAQARLRHAMDTWAAVHSADDLSTNYRRFYHTFGVDVLSAMAYSRKDAEALHDRIAARLLVDGYVILDQTYPVPSLEAA